MIVGNTRMIDHNSLRLCSTTSLSSSIGNTELIQRILLVNSISTSTSITSLLDRPQACRNQSRSSRCFLITIVTLKNNMSIVTSLRSELNSHYLINGYVYNLITKDSTCRIGYCIRELIVLNRLELSGLNERQLNTLDTLPVETGLQHEALEILINQNLDSVELVVHLSD